MIRIAELETEEHDAVAVARLSGEIDLSNVADIGDALALVPSPGALGLVIDMTGLRHVDSAGVRMLFDLRRRFGQHRQHIALAVPGRARVRDVLELAAVGERVPILPDVPAAVAAVRAAAGE